jgi:hypothetical protein
MMDRIDAIAKLKEHEAELKQLGVEHLYHVAQLGECLIRSEISVDDYLHNLVCSFDDFAGANEAEG